MIIHCGVEDEAAKIMDKVNRSSGANTEAPVSPLGIQYLFRLCRSRDDDG